MGESLSDLLRALADRLVVVGPDRIVLAEELRQLAERVALQEAELGKLAVEAYGRRLDTASTKEPLPADDAGDAFTLEDRCHVDLSGARPAVSVKSLPANKPDISPPVSKVPPERDDDNA